MFQKVVLAVLMIASLSPAIAQARGLILEPFTVDWTKGTMDQTGVLVCDDNFYNGAKILVSGDRESFRFSFERGSDATIKGIREIKAKDGSIKTQIIILSTMGFAIDLINRDGNNAIIDMADGC